MFLKNVTLANIKKYKAEHTFEFENRSFINTISGKNGSGKSTIFDSVVLCQKAYFAQLLEPEGTVIINSNGQLEITRREQVAKEFATLASDSTALISVTFGFSKEELVAVGTTEMGSENEHVKLSLVGNNILGAKCDWMILIDTAREREILSKFWNLENPTNIVVMLDADKNVYEDDFSYRKINLITEGAESPIINFVMDSRNIYQHMYDIMMNAYVYQRINPQKPRRDEFVNQSMKMFSDIMENVAVSNFSGKQLKDQFVLLAKNDVKYDVRNLSSGEKLIWYVVLLLNYLKNMGLLIIDEPENHLHEQLAWKFVLFLQNILNQIDGHITIGQVFLITHAKNLIYNNFSTGSNYLVRDDSINLISHEECEKVLRSCGISFIEEKILFVEGNTEEEHLEKLCNENNIKIRQLPNCSTILQVYKSLLQVKELVTVPKFVFMIDRDTRTGEKIQELRTQDSTFFDDHIVFLPVHEIENFLLDEQEISDILNDYLQDCSDIRVSADEILQKMRAIADEALRETKKKYLNFELDAEVKGLAQMVNQRNIDVSSKEAYSVYVHNLLSGDAFSQRVENMVALYDAMEREYSDENWDNKWKSLCDGKIVFNRLCSQLGRENRMDVQSLKEKVFRRALKNPNSSFMTYWRTVIQRL